MKKMSKSKIMALDLNLFGRGRRRIKQRNAVIESDDRSLLISRSQTTEISDVGDIRTDETIRSIIIGNEKISSHLQI